MARRRMAMAKSGLDRFKHMLSIHYVIYSECFILFSFLDSENVDLQSQEIPMQKIVIFFCINFDEVINLVVKVNFLGKKSTNDYLIRPYFTSLNEMDWIPLF